MNRILTVAVALVATLVLTAQSSYLSTETRYKEVLWESYNITLEVPSDFNITRNDAFWLEGSNRDFEIAFTAYVNSSHDAEDAAWKAYDGLGYTDMKQTRSEALKNGEMEGWEIIGSGYKNNDPKVFIAKGMEDPYGKNLYYGTIVYGTGGDTRAKSYIAIDISNSFEIKAPQKTSGNSNNTNSDPEEEDRMKSYDWSTYNTKFEVPEYTSLKENTGEHFQTGDGDMELNIYPLRGYAYEVQTMAKDHLNDMDLSSVKITSEQSFTPNDYEGYYIIGNAYRGRTKVVYIVAGISDPTSDVNFKFDITYSSSSPKISEYVTDAIAALFSFESMGESEKEPEPEPEPEYGDNIKVYSEGAYKVVEWLDKDFTFKYPEDFRVTQNDEYGFKGDDGNFYMEIEYLKGFDYTPQNLVNELYEELGATDKQNQADRDFSRNENNGWEIIGSGQMNGENVVYYLIGLTDFTSDKNYKINMYFYNRDDRGDEYVDKVSTVAKSFGKLK